MFSIFVQTLMHPTCSGASGGMILLPRTITPPTVDSFAKNFWLMLFLGGRKNISIIYSHHYLLIFWIQGSRFVWLICVQRIWRITEVDNLPHVGIITSIKPWVLFFLFQIINRASISTAVQSILSPFNYLTLKRKSGMLLRWLAIILFVIGF